MEKFGYMTPGEQIVNGPINLEWYTSDLGSGKVKWPTAPSSGISASKKKSYHVFKISPSTYYSD